MHPSDGNETSLAELRELRSEIKQWALGIRCVFTVLTVLPLYYCTRALLAAPKFERIFEDMLGPQEKLPVLTGLLFEWAMPLLGCLWLLAALMILLIFTFKQPRHVWITAAITTFALIASSHIIATLLFDPLIGIVQNLTGGGENLP